MRNLTILLLTIVVAAGCKSEKAKAPESVNKHELSEPKKIDIKIIPIGVIYGDSYYRITYNDININTADKGSIGAWVGSYSGAIKITDKLKTLSDCQQYNDSITNVLRNYKK